MAPHRACSNQGSRLAKSVQGGWQYLIPVSVVFRFLTAHHKKVRIFLGLEYGLYGIYMEDSLNLQNAASTKRSDLKKESTLFALNFD